MSASDIYDKAVILIKAWTRMRPEKSFFRMSLEDFGATVRPSGEAREEIAKLEASMQEALARRDEADKITRRAILRIVNGVKGDPDEGEDGELLAAMGYLPHTAKSSITSMARKAASKAAAAQNAGNAEEDKG